MTLPAPPPQASKLPLLAVSGYRVAVALLLATGWLAPRRAEAQSDTAALQRVLMAEDERGTGPAGIAPILDALRASDSLLRRVAVRGLGRLQRPALAVELLPALADPVPAVRMEAANAVAQSLSRVARTGADADSGRRELRRSQQALWDALSAERDPAVAAAIAEAAGRLPYGDSASARRAESAVLARAGAAPLGAIQGLFWLARARRATGALSPDAVALLRRAALSSGDTLVRRTALLALTATGALDSALVVAAFGDPDAQVRRLAVAGAGHAGIAGGVILRHARSDSSPIVRIALAAAVRASAPTPDCAPLVALLRDPDAWVALAATDALGAPCTDAGAVAGALEALLLRPPDDVVPDHRWQRPAHALVALARTDPVRARRHLARFAAAPRWQERIYAALAAAPLGDAPLLTRLARDPDHNVQEAAIAGLAGVAGHDADSVYVAALASSGNQVVLAAAQALAGTRDPAVMPALLAAFDSIGAARRENARDPRLEILKRIGELGSSADAGRLSAHLADFDTTVAAAVAELLTRWSGVATAPRAAPLPIAPAPLARVLLAGDIRVRFTMAASSGGGSFTVRLFGDDATATTARILALIRRGFYDGRRFQRVVPNFVIQGGGPDANEYVGDSLFIRDELGRRGNLRGTAGMSSRGRDTGDAQWYFNVVDNTRLDHEYTVFGEVVAGMDVLERILEEDLIAGVVVIRGPR